MEGDRARIQTLHHIVYYTRKTDEFMKGLNVGEKHGRRFMRLMICKMLIYKRIEAERSEYEGEKGA